MEFQVSVASILFRIDDEDSVYMEFKAALGMVVSRSPEKPSACLDFQHG